ncbi:TetR/AcrR family transcriptional regulator [Burkholderia plantarii]|uniref:TetR/AcrR family transcriptional regulator n=1 Tax=Burkholderia plantarii TaxID=41899 RepID=UPI0018DBD8AF|nr:TetR/AcrR family transcriptional regulator [Burkholderia plantarii]MBI0328379.1 TetR/AcrR family transcriptional regulator [Burkholderia plantarii]
MKPKRLTREQSKDQTRERLLNSAHAIFTKKGYVAASVEDIAAAAGYTRGAFYSNFGGKAELLFELLRRDHEMVRAELNRIVEAGGTRERMEANALAFYSGFLRKSPAFLLWSEARLQAARDAKFRVRYIAFMREKLEDMAHTIEMFAEQSGTPLLLPAEVLAIGLMGLCDGVQALHVADPQHVSLDQTEATLAGFFARVVLGRAPD